MGYPIRRARAEDFAAIADLDGASFGSTHSPEDLADALLIVDMSRFLVATDGDQIVGVTGDFPFEMTLPGGAELPVPGVTWVSVDPVYRRRGILRALMEHQLRGYREDGIAAAILTASEGGIYARYGYGVASHIRKTVLNRRQATLAAPVDAGAVRRVDKQTARRLMPDIHRRWRTQTPGAISRTEPWWDMLMLDREGDRGGMSALFFLLHPDGYVAYRIKSDWGDGDPRHLCWLSDYVVSTPAAHAALWQVLLGLDLIGSIESFRIPLDDPLPFLLADARQVRTTLVDDSLWVRPLDPAVMLAARSYAVEVEAVIEVADELVGDVRMLLRCGPDGAECTRTDRVPDLVLGAAELGAVYLGGTRLHALARAGRVRADDPTLLARLDRALLADREPVHGTSF